MTFESEAILIILAGGLARTARLHFDAYCRRGPLMRSCDCLGNLFDGTEACPGVDHKYRRILTSLVHKLCGKARLKRSNAPMMRYPPLLKSPMYGPHFQIILWPSSVRCDRTGHAVNGYTPAVYHVDRCIRCHASASSREY